MLSYIKKPYLRVNKSIFGMKMFIFFYNDLIYFVKFKGRFSIQKGLGEVIRIKILLFWFLQVKVA